MFLIDVAWKAAPPEFPTIGANSGLTLPDAGSTVDAKTGVFIPPLVPEEYCWKPARPKPSPPKPDGALPKSWALAALNIRQQNRARNNRMDDYHHTQENLWPVVAAIIETAWLLPNPGGVV